MLDKEKTGKKGPRLPPTPFLTDMARGPRQGKGPLSFSGTSFILKRGFKNICDLFFSCSTKNSALIFDSVQPVS